MGRWLPARRLAPTRWRSDCTLAEKHPPWWLTEWRHSTCRTRRGCRPCPMRCPSGCCWWCAWSCPSWSCGQPAGGPATASWVGRLATIWSTTCEVCPCTTLPRRRTSGRTRRNPPCHTAHLLCALAILDDQFVALEAIGRGEDAGRADFGHCQCPLGGLTAKLQPLDVAVDDSRGERCCVLGALADGCVQDDLGEHEVR